MRFCFNDVVLNFLQVFYLLVSLVAVGIYFWTTRTHVRDFTLFAADVERAAMTGNQRNDYYYYNILLLFIKLSVKSSL